jgi:hypothetical protein
MRESVIKKQPQKKKEDLSPTRVEEMNAEKKGTLGVNLTLSPPAAKLIHT